MIFKIKGGSNLIITNENCAKSVTIYTIFNVGSRDEVKKDRGIAHFLEHILFKGTYNHPNGREIVQIVDKYGGTFNAFTSRDMTAFYIKLPSKHLKVAINILSDIIYNSTLLPRDIESEKNIILNEIRQRNSDPENIVDNLLSKILFKGTTLENDIGGDERSIMRVNRESLINFIGKHYQRRGLIISIAGNVKPSIKTIVKYVNEKFSKPITKQYSCEKIKYCRKLFPNLIKGSKSSRLKIKYQPGLNHTFITIGFIIPSFKDPHSWILEIIGIILAGTMGSRLFDELREKRSLVYSVSYDINLYEDIGIFTISCSTFNDKKSIKETLNIIFNEINKIDTITEDELKRAKDYSLNSLDMKRESTNEVALTQASEFIYLKRVLTKSDLTKFYTKITPDVVVKTANKYFKNPTTVILTNSMLKGKLKNL